MGWNLIKVSLQSDTSHMAPLPLLLPSILVTLNQTRHRGASCVKGLDLGQMQCLVQFHKCHLSQDWYSHHILQFKRCYASEATRAH